MILKGKMWFICSKIRDYIFEKKIEVVNYSRDRQVFSFRFTFFEKKYVVNYFRDR